MKMYVCSPYFQEESTQKKAENMLMTKVGSSYKDLEIEFCAKSEYTVYVMGKTRFPLKDKDDEVRSRIEYCVKHVAGTSSTPEVKLNYSQLNPHFVPVAEDLSSSSAAAGSSEENVSEEFDYDKLSMNYHAEEPKYSFRQVRLGANTHEHIMEAIGIIEVETKVFDEWGLRAIIPEAASALSFYGPPGTGKTMAAHAVADYLGKKILLATYADIESKFHGEGPKMVKAIFKAAEREDAVLFLDESDSLLSKRLTNVSEGSSQAINSMRSQLLVSLESFRGVVIFATNLVVNYDKAFLSRLINVEFVMPDAEIRNDIWKNHVQSEKVRIPLAEDVDLSVLAEKYEFSGREIKNAVKNACVSAALQKRDIVLQDDFLKACDRVESETEKAVTARDHAAMEKNDSQASLKNAFQKVLDKEKLEENKTEEVKVDESE